MKKIINNKIYDTDTALLIGESQYSNRRDFNYIFEGLYRKKTGEFFIHGEGGANTRYAESYGNNSWGAGETIIPVDFDTARKWAEENLDADDYLKYFEADEGGDDYQFQVRLPIADRAKLDQLRGGTKTLSEVIHELIDKA